MIKAISFDDHSYSIVLFNQLVIDNIANFCCTEKSEFKSPLCFDFTFDLGNAPSFYVLFLSLLTMRSPSSSKYHNLRDKSLNQVSLRCTTKGARAMVGQYL